MSSQTTSPKECPKIHILLDIDETLLYFINHRVRAHSWDTLSAAEQQKYTVIETKHRDLIIPRPHLQKFLTFLFKHFNVSLWTLSDREYAESIAALLITNEHPERKIKHIFSADDDEEHDVPASEIHGNPKDLNWLWYEYPMLYPCFAECNTILIDDLPANALNPSNRQNTIHIRPFALFGEVKKRTDPYTDVSQDDIFLKIIILLTRLVKSYSADTFSSDDRWTPIFSEENWKKYKVQSFVKETLYKNTPIKSIRIG